MATARVTRTQHYENVRFLVVFIAVSIYIIYGPDGLPYIRVVCQTKQTLLDVFFQSVTQAYSAYSFKKHVQQTLQFNRFYIFSRSMPGLRLGL